MTTGIGAPLAGVYYTLSGLAAVVIGGVSLAGGRGGMFGPVIAAFVLTLIPTDLIFLNIDPNFGQVIQGTLIVAIVMIGGSSRTWREIADDRASQDQLRARRAGPFRSRRCCRCCAANARRADPVAAWPLSPASKSLEPGTVNALWLSNMVLFAAPLGILAAGQTMVMLTGGIDLSVASVATASAYLMATRLRARRRLVRGLSDSRSASSSV